MRIVRSAALVGVLSTALVSAAPALAAPDRSTTFDPYTSGTFSWTSAPNVGLAPTTATSNALSCDLRMCDDTLIRIDETGRITASILGDQPTLVDVDLYLYRSDATGAPLSLITAVTDFDADESVTVIRQPPGYYLIRADWSLGVGTVSGKVTYTPQPPPAA